MYPSRGLVNGDNVKRGRFSRPPGSLIGNLTRREEQRAAEAAAGRVRELEAEVLQEKMRSREREEEERGQWLEKEAGWRAELRWKERVLVAVERKRGREVAELREELEEAQRDGRERVERCSGDG